MKGMGTVAGCRDLRWFSPLSFCLLSKSGPRAVAQIPFFEGYVSLVLFHIIVYNNFVDRVQM